jgi:hypothetical protein
METVQKKISTTPEKDGRTMSQRERETEKELNE